MLRLKNIRIPFRIAVVCLLPLIAFVGFAGYETWEQYKSYASAEKVMSVAEMTAMNSLLIHELQKERGNSGGFIGSRGISFADNLRAQRILSDKVLASWQQQMEQMAGSNSIPAVAKHLQEARQELAGLANLRGRVDALAVDQAQSAKYYTSVIGHLTTTIDAIGELAHDGRIIHGLRAVSALVKRKEFAGQERAMGSGIFASGEVLSTDYFRFLDLGSRQGGQAAAFEDSATPVQRDFLNNTMKGPVTEDHKRLQAAVASFPFNETSMRGITGEHWFQTATKHIDALKTVEDKMNTDLVITIQGVVSEARQGFWASTIIFIAVLMITGALAAVVTLSITRPIGKLVAMMGQLAKGNTEMAVPGAERGDEVGAMAKAVQVFRDNAIRVHAMEAEQKETEKRAAEEREANTAKVMNEFDAAVGGIVKAAVAGDFSQRVPLEGKEGVIRNIASAMNTMCENIEKAMNELVTMFGALAEGDLTRRITADYEGIFAALKDDANVMAERIGATMSEIKSTSREVANAAGEISSSTTDLSQRTEEQAASLEETSASMEQIAGTVKHNAENAKQANQFSNSARQVADRGGEVAAKAVEAMSKIEESSKKISDIIGVIDEIAFQTNLLALNAAVEAARAGEAGRGFAVVASEVRRLAQRSSQAAKDIKDLINHSTGQVKDGVDLVNRAGASLNEIVESIKKVADIVAQIANASSEQAMGIDQVKTALVQMDEVTQQNSALVEENAAAAKTLEHQSVAMDERVSFFKLDGSSAAASKSFGAAEKPAAAPRPQAARQLNAGAKRSLVG